MENTILNTQEFENLEKRGFFVKKNYQFIDLANSLGNIVVYTCLFIILSTFPIGFSMVFFIPLGENPTIPGYIASGMIILYYIIFGIFPILNFFFSYFTSGVSFFTDNGIIEFGKINGNRFKSLFFIDNTIKRIMASREGWIGGGVIGLFITSMIAIFLIGSDSLPFIIANSGNSLIFTIFFNELIAVILLGIFLFPLLVLLFIGRYCFQYFSPIYTFGNLGEKIQSLTPQIEQQSKKIQSEFQSDMNFSVLSNGFDSLSATFSEIVSLVIKLEKVEARANKGNLFDSEKYINSLRLDIVEPLQSLRSFLENQKKKLLESQQELSRVRVGGSESTSNVELQSKRSESLITELTENIEKLDVMIEKME